MSLVVEQQGRGLPRVDLHAPPDGVLVVVGAAFLRGPVEQARDQHIRLHQQRDHGVQMLPSLREITVQKVDLVHGAGKSVQQEPGGAVRLG